MRAHGISGRIFHPNMKHNRPIKNSIVLSVIPDQDLGVDGRERRGAEAGHALCIAIGAAVASSPNSCNCWISSDLLVVQ